MRYVALGSSMAAGPGIPPRARDSNFRAGRSENNYAHLLAKRLGYDLVDLTYSGATTSDLQRRQVGALDGTESLVTITAGGNDIGYVPALITATLPRPLRFLAKGALPSVARAELLTSLENLADEVRRRSPGARIVFVDYLSLLPPDGPVRGFSAADLERCRTLERDLREATAEAAETSGAELVRASRASRDHHPWAAIPWCNGPGLPIPGRPMPFHPNEVGMRAVAALLTEHLSG